MVVAVPALPLEQSTPGRSTGTSAVALDGACLRGKCEADTALGYRLMARFARLTQQRLQETRLQLLDLYGRHGPGAVRCPLTAPSPGRWSRSPTG